MYYEEELGCVDKKYGGVVTDISKLPIGTVFYTFNGAWVGKIVRGLCPSGKALEVYDDTFVGNDGKRRLVNFCDIVEGSESNFLSISINESESLVEESNDTDKYVVPDVEELDNSVNDWANLIAKAPQPGKTGRVIPWGGIKPLDLDKRYTLPDESPCSFCDIGLGMDGAKCPWKEMPDAMKRDKCRAYFYFELLQKYESQKFGK